MAKITLPQIFQNGMVLQRNKSICIWGEAEGCSEITVTLAENSAFAKVEDGKWQLYLPPMQAGSNYTMNVSSGSETVQFTDVAIGEVWLAGGQSNMEFLLRFDADAEESKKIVNSDIRCFEVPKRSYEGQEKDDDYSQVGLWRKQGGDESLYFTAVGFYFANKLHETLNVPIGIINCTWGGTSASVFTSKEYLTGNLSWYVEQADKCQNGMDYDEGLKEYRKLLEDLYKMPMDMAIINEAPIYPDDAMTEFFNKLESYHFATFSPFSTSVLYRTMLLTVVPFSISGVIWYQGESDEPHSELYEELLSAMIRCWRDLWKEELPFILVQLASFERMMEELDFVPVRAIQEKVSKTVPKVNIICSMDVGLQYDIHPKKKKPIGERLALQALSKVYGYNILSDSPSVSAYSKTDGCIDIEFADCGSGLYADGDKPQTIDLIIDGVTVTDKEVSVSGNHMIIHSDEISSDKKVTVSFSWHPYCVDNVYNSAGLPMLPFTIDI